jgi:5S rRNA maturation endonuclease (ribonuclease M5)
MNKQLTIAEVKERITMREVLEMLGMPRPSGTGKIACIFHADKSPSLHIYPDHWYAFCCGRRGDVIDFVAEAQGTTTRGAYHMLLEKVGGRQPLGFTRMSYDRHFAPVRRDFRRELEAKSEATVSQDLERLVRTSWPGAGITADDLIYQWKCRVTDTQLLIPHWRDGKVHAVKTRHLVTGEKRSWPGSTYGPSMYMLPTGAIRGRACYIVEGESDTWALHIASRGANVYGLPSGASMWKDEWIDIHRLHEYPLVLVATDMDEAGEAAARRILAAIPRAVRVQLPDEDVVASIQKGWTPPW